MTAEERPLRAPGHVRIINRPSIQGRCVSAAKAVGLEGLELVRCMPNIAKRCAFLPGSPIMHSAKSVDEFHLIREPEPIPWWQDPETEVAHEADTSRAFVTYHCRAGEVAIVSWWYGSPTLIALFRGGELVAGELKEAG